MYINTWMDASILPAGYTKWTSNPLTNNYNNYTIMAEYGSSGPGFNLTARLLGNVTQELNATTILPYDSPRDIFMTPTGQIDITWIDKRMIRC
jgi:hypothetical protein